MSLAEGRTKAIGQGRLGGQPLWMPRTSVSHLLHFSCPQKTGPNFKLASASLPLPSSQLPFLGKEIQLVEQVGGNSQEAGLAGIPLTQPCTLAWQPCSGRSSS